MDLELPTMSGIDAINAIKVDEPNARVIVLTMHDEEEMIYRALQAGAATYLLKDTLLKDLVRVIREVHAGNSPLPDDVAAHLERRSSEHALTPRETAVIELIGRGMTDRTIATVLNISEKTVHVHVRNCLDKLGVDNRTAAARVALRRGIVQLK